MQNPIIQPTLHISRPVLRRELFRAFPEQWRQGLVGGVALQQHSVAVVAHSHRLRRRRKRHFVVWTFVAENVSTIPTVVLKRKRFWSVWHSRERGNSHERALAAWLGASPALTPQRKHCERLERCLFLEGSVGGCGERRFSTVKRTNISLTFLLDTEKGFWHCWQFLTALSSAHWASFKACCTSFMSSYFNFDLKSVVQRKKFTRTFLWTLNQANTILALESHPFSRRVGSVAFSVLRCAHGRCCLFLIWHARIIPEDLDAAPLCCQHNRQNLCCRKPQYTCDEMFAEIERPFDCGISYPFLFTYHWFPWPLKTSFPRIPKIAANFAGQIIEINTFFRNGALLKCAQSMRTG